MPLNFLRDDGEVIQFTEQRLAAYKKLAELQRDHPDSIQHIGESLATNPKLPWIVKPYEQYLPMYKSLSETGVLNVRIQNQGFMQLLLIVDIKDKPFLDFAFNGKLTLQHLQTQDTLSDPNNPLNSLSTSKEIDTDIKRCCIIC